MKQFNVCCMISGCLDVVVEAENEEEAMAKAKDECYGMNWNDMWCPEIDAADIYEEVTP